MHVVATIDAPVFLLNPTQANLTLPFFRLTVALMILVQRSFIFNLIPVEDLERNDGSPERPYLMPESLRKVLNKKNKTQPAQ